VATRVASLRAVHAPFRAGQRRLAEGLLNLVKGKVNTPSLEADGFNFTEPLKVGQRRLTPTGERAGVAMPPVAGHGPTIGGRRATEAHGINLPPRHRAQARLNVAPIRPAPRGFRPKLPPEGEGFNPPKWDNERK